MIVDELNTLNNIEVKMLMEVKIFDVAAPIVYLLKYFSFVVVVYLKMGVKITYMTHFISMNHFISLYRMVFADWICGLDVWNVDIRSRVGAGTKNLRVRVTGWQKFRVQIRQISAGFWAATLIRSSDIKSVDIRGVQLT